MANKIGTASERYSLAWWKEWMAIADGLEWNASRMFDAARKAVAAMEASGEDAMPPCEGSEFLCMLFQLKDTMEGVWSETFELEEEYAETLERMYDYGYGEEEE